MRKSKNVIVISVLAAIVCIFLLKILTRDNVVKIDIGYQSVTAQTWGALILKANSIYEEKLAERFSETDFQITWHDETSGAIINENMISLKYQFGFMGDLPCLINGNKGLLMDQYNSSLLCFDGKGMEGVNQSIIVRASDGISSINELKGKNIGVPIGSSAHRMLMDLLLKNQIAEDEVTLIHTEINVGYQMLKNGYIDAMCVWEPYGAIFLSDMELEMLISGEETGVDYLDGVMINTDWADEHKEYISAFLDSLSEAHELLINYPEKASVQIADETGFDEKTVLGIINNIKWEMKINETDIDTLNQGMMFLNQLGALTEFDTESIVYKHER